MTPQDYNSEYNRPTQSPQEYPRVEGALKIMLCSTFTWLFRGWRKHGKLIWKRSDKLDADEFGRALQYHLSTGWAARAGTLACQCTVQAIAQLMFCCKCRIGRMAQLATQGHYVVFCAEGEVPEPVFAHAS